MVYIHKKKIGAVTYYTLRMSVRKGERVVVKDLANLGTDITKIHLEDLDKKFSKEIRKSYKTIKKFLDSQHYLHKTQQKKLKKQPLLKKEDVDELASAKMHYEEQFLTLPAQTQEDLLEYYLIRFAVNSSGIEGNTIGLQEASKLLLYDIAPKNTSGREIFDLINTKKSFYYLQKEKPDLSEELIVTIHDMLLENIDKRTGIRDHDIRIFKQPFVPTPALYVKNDLALLLKWYNEQKNQLHPFILAVLFHHKFEQIHPFSDGNGRTGRMIMNYILLQHHYPPIVIDKRDRKEYLDVMSQADTATKTDLLAINESYEPLLSFVIYQLKKSYWDIFLT